MALDLGAVDALARLHLAGRRLGFTVWLVTPAEELLELLALAGLVEMIRQAEEREQALGVEEERELGDPPA
jgi:hypothetical protein